MCHTWTAPQCEDYFFLRLKSESDSTPEVDAIGSINPLVQSTCD